MSTRRSQITNVSPSSTPTAVPDAWMEREVNSTGLTRYAQIMAMLGEAFSKPLNQGTFDAYRLAARAADCEADFALAVGHWIDEKEWFPKVHELREQIQRVRGERVVAERRACAHDPAAPRPVTYRRLTMDSLGATDEDQIWWRGRAHASSLPRGLREGVFVPPQRDRVALLVVSDGAALRWWHERRNTTARRMVEGAIAVQYHLGGELSIAYRPILTSNAVVPDGDE